MYKRLFVTFIIVLLLSNLQGYSFPPNWIPDNTIIIKGESNSPPFEFINTKGEPDGFNVDMIKAAMEELGYNDYIIELAEPGSFYCKPVSQKDSADIFLGMIYYPEGNRKIQFALPLTMINIGVVLREGEFYSGLNDLKGKQIIIVSDPWSTDFIKKQKLSDNLLTVKDIEDGLKLMESGKGDILLGNEEIILHFIKNLKLKNLKVAESGIKPLKYSVALPKRNDNLLYQINLAIQKLKMSGRYDSIYDKWFGIATGTKIGEIFFMVIFTLAAIATFMTVFAWILRKRVKKAVRLQNSSKQELEMAFDAGKISAWSYNIETKKLSKLRGEIFEEGEIIDVVLTRVHPEDVSSLAAAFNDLSAGTRSKSYECFRIKRNSGDVSYSVYEIIMARIEKTPEAPCRIIGTLKNVTDEIKLKNQLEDYRLKTIFITETNGITLMQYDLLQKIFIKLNSSGEIDEKEKYTKTEFLDNVYPEDIPLALKFITSMEMRNEGKISAEFRFMDKEGNYEWYSTETAAYKRNTAGEILSYIGLRRNNSKWKQITDNLISLRNKAEVSNKIKSAFLANMSHEIRTPLNAIVGFSSLIADSENKEEKEQFRNIIKTNSEQLLQLIDDILDLSKIEAGYLELKYTGFNLGEYLQNLCSALALRKPENIEFIYKTDDFSINIYSDKNRIGQIITNFVMNSFKFTLKGSVSLDYTYRDEHLIISVTDTGIGISGNNIKKIFDRFEKLNDFAQGTGLGLSICKALANAMNGDIYVNSQEGKGSRFILKLPCNIVPEKPDSNNITKDIAMRIIKDTPLHINNEQQDNDGKKNLLIAEDMDNNYILAYKLLKDDFNITRARNGEEAVEYAVTQSPDYILMDMKMPVMDGLEATRKIREFNKNIPIIALTAYVFDTDKNIAVESGCSGFLAKPLNREHLFSELKIIKNK